MHVTSPGYLFDVKVHLYLFLKRDQAEGQHGQEKLSLNTKIKLKGIGAIRSGSKELITLWKEEEVLYNLKHENYYNKDEKLKLWKW